MEPRKPDGGPTTKQNPRQQDTSDKASNGMLSPLGFVDEPSTTGRRLARERVRAIDRRRRLATMADELMPLAVWYRQPKGAFYCTIVEDWTWAA